MYEAIDIAPDLLTAFAASLQMAIDPRYNPLSDLNTQFYVLLQQPNRDPKLLRPLPNPPV